MKIHEINAKNKKNYYSSKWVIYQVIRGSNPLIPTLNFEQYVNLLNETEGMTEDEAEQIALSMILENDTIADGLLS